MYAKAMEVSLKLVATIVSLKKSKLSEPGHHLVGRVFANGPGDQGSIPRQVIPKTQKMELYAALHNTQHYKLWIKGEVEQSRGRSSPLPNTSV